MELSGKERELIKSGRIHAVLRWEKVEEKAGDIIFSVNRVAYRLKEKKRWAVHRVAAKRSNIDFGCKDVKAFISLFTYLYSDYKKSRKDIVYDVIFEKEKSQRTLGW